MNRLPAPLVRNFAQPIPVALIIVALPAAPAAPAGDPLGFDAVRAILGPDAIDNRPVRTGVAL